MPSSKTILAVLVAMLLAACTSPFKSEVSRFHRLAYPQGETFMIVAQDERKEGGLEFGQYAGLIAGKLKDIGYTPVEVGAAPDLIVLLDYRVSDGMTQIRSRPSNFVHYHFGYRRYYDPFYYGDAWDYPEVYSYVVYARKLTMTIRRGSTGGEVLFEGRVESTGRSNHMQEVMPYLVTAMFTNFPGESGVTKVVTIERD